MHFCIDAREKEKQMSGESTIKFHSSVKYMATVELDYDQAMYLSETLKHFSAPEGVQAITLSRYQHVLAN